MRPRRLEPGETGTNRRARWFSRSPAGRRPGQAGRFRRSRDPQRDGIAEDGGPQGKVVSAWSAASEAEGSGPPCRSGGGYPAYRLPARLLSGPRTDPPAVSRIPPRGTRPTPRASVSFMPSPVKQGPGDPLPGPGKILPLPATDGRGGNFPPSARRHHSSGFLCISFRRAQRRSTSVWKESSSGLHSVRRRCLVFPIIWSQSPTGTFFPFSSGS